MDGGTITQLTWCISAALQSGWRNANFQVFVKEVGATTLSAYSGTAGATVVYEGTIDPTAGTEVVIPFSQPYVYQGGNLLIGCYNTARGTTYQSCKFMGKTLEIGVSAYGSSSSSLDEASFNRTAFLPKTTFSYTAAVYGKPKSLVVSGITTESATVTWEPGGTETAWNVGYKKPTDEQWTELSVTTTSATLADLDRATTYDVRVQADYGEGNLSEWTTTSFATEICDDADKGQISYQLSDSQGDGWSDNAVSIVHHDTGIVMATLTIASDSSATGTVEGLCYGETYDIVWTKGLFSDECSFVISGEGGVIYECPLSSTGPTPGVLHRFVLRRVACKRPTALTAGQLAYNAATLTWTPGDDDQDNWQVAYGTGDDFDPDAQGVTVVTANITPTVTLGGLAELTTYHACVRSNCGDGGSLWTDLVQFTTADENTMPASLTVDEVKAHSATASWTGAQEAYNLRYRCRPNTIFEDFEAGIPDTWTTIDADGDGYNWTVYATASQNPTDANGNPIVLGTAAATSASYDNATRTKLTPDNWLVTPLIDLGGTLSVWLRGQIPDQAAEHFAIYVSTTGNSAEDFTTELVPETVATGVFQEYTADLSAYASQRGYIAIRHFNCTDQFQLNVDNFGVYGEVGEWVTVQNVTSPYTISGLMASSHYEVEVQGIVGEQTTAWTDAVVFATAHGLLGDINGDDKVDVGDVNITINIMLGKDSPANHPGDADVSGDGQVDVSDINAIVNIILGKN